MYYGRFPVALVAFTLIISACGGSDTSNKQPTPVSSALKQTADVSGVMAGLFSKLGPTNARRKGFVDTHSSRTKAQAACSEGGSIDVRENNETNFYSARVVFSQCLEPAGNGLQRLIEGVLLIEDQDADGTVKLLTFGEMGQPLSLAVRPQPDGAATQSYEINVLGTNRRQLDEETGQFESVLSISGVYVDNVAGQTYSYQGSEFSLQIRNSDGQDRVDINGGFGANAGSASVDCEAVDASISTLSSLLASPETGEISSGVLQVEIEQATLNSSFSPNEFAVSSGEESATFSRSEVAQRCDVISEALARLITDFQ